MGRNTVVTKIRFFVYSPPPVPAFFDNARLFKNFWEKGSLLLEKTLSERRSFYYAVFSI